MFRPLAHFKISRARLRNQGLISDVAALRGIAIFSEEPPRGELNAEIFEEKYCESSIEDVRIRSEEIERRLGVMEVSGAFRGIERPLSILGETLREQVESVLPPGLDENERTSLGLAIGHILLNDMSPAILVEPLPQGLDALAAGVLAINNIAQLIGKRPRLLYEIWKWRSREIKKRVLSQIYERVKETTDLGEIESELEQQQMALSKSLPQDNLLLEKIPEWRVLIGSFAREDMASTSVGATLRKLIRGEQDRLEKSIPGKIEVTLRADTLVRREHRPLLHALGQSINVLQRREIYDLFLDLSAELRLNQPTVARIMKITGLAESTAGQFLQRVQPIIVERLVPSLSSLGLRYRYLLGTYHNVPLPNAGKVDSLLVGARRRKVTVHVEPYHSQGPKRPMRGVRQFVVDRERVSFRLDLFNRATGDWLAPWVEGKRPPRIRARAFAETQLAEEPERLPPRAIELLSVLWALRMNNRARLRVLKHLKMNTVMSEMGRLFVRQGLLSVMYHPSIRFIGLPESLFVAASDLRPSDITHLTKWIATLFPFARVRYSNVRRGEQGDLVAEILLPRFSRAIAKEIITKRLSEVAEFHLAESIISNASFYLSGLYRAYDFKKRRWLDPWSR